MSAPSQPQLSDDGRFFWDGQRWAPVPASEPKKRWYQRQVASSGMVIVLIVLFVFVMVAVVNS